MVQDIVIATLLNASVELPTRVHTRRNCHFSNVSCTNIFYEGPSLWDVYDHKRLLALLRFAGVSVVPPIRYRPMENTSLCFETSFRGPAVPRLHFPVAATRLENLTAASFNLTGVTCSFGLFDCCTRLVPDTIKAVELLKAVNFAFQSAQKFRAAALDVISAVNSKTEQHFSVAMHWRLDMDFILSAHVLSPQDYCIGMLDGIELIINRTSSENVDNSSIIDILVLGDSDVRDVQQILDGCNYREDHVPIYYKLHSKETLLSSDSPVLGDNNTDVKGQLDFELGAQADYFLGSPFSSFSVLIAFYRYSAPHHDPSKTVMAEVDVKDKLAKIFEVQFPYSDQLVAAKTKCTTLTEVARFFRAPLKPCVLLEFHDNRTTQLPLWLVRGTPRRQRHRGRRRSHNDEEISGWVMLLIIGIWWTVLALLIIFLVLVCR